MINSGYCGDAHKISTTSECEAAATALGLSDKTATDHTSITSTWDPPGCMFSSNYLYFVGGRSTGSCNSWSVCICKSTLP